MPTDSIIITIIIISGSLMAWLLSS